MAFTPPTEECFNYVPFNPDSSPDNSPDNDALTISWLLSHGFIPDATTWWASSTSFRYYTIGSATRSLSVLFTRPKPDDDNTPLVPTNWSISNSITSCSLGSNLSLACVAELVEVLRKAQ